MVHALNISALALQVNLWLLPMKTALWYNMEGRLLLAQISINNNMTGGH